ncbi:MAG: preprotein translocase subunit SecG [Candidatus Binataceae bacterium]
MVSIVIAIHVIICVTLCVIVLLQQGKGAEIGAVFGGSSSTVFGSSGAGNMLTKLTWAAATVFFATSLFLAYASTRRVNGSIFEGGGISLKSSAPISRSAVPANRSAVPVSGAPGSTVPGAAPLGPAPGANPASAPNH